MWTDPEKLAAQGWPLLATDVLSGREAEAARGPGSVRRITKEEVAMADHEPHAAMRAALRDEDDRSVLEERLARLETKVGLIDPPPVPPERYEMAACLAAVAAGFDLFEATVGAGDLPAAVAALEPSAGLLGDLVRRVRQAVSPVDRDVFQWVCQGAFSGGPIERCDWAARGLVKEARAVESRGLPAANLASRRETLRDALALPQIVTLIAEAHP